MVLQELKAYPGQGLPLIKADLGAPVVRCRNTALHVLEAWTSDSRPLDEYDPELRPILMQLQRTEVNKNAKETIAALLSEKR